MGQAPTHNGTGRAQTSATTELAAQPTSTLVVELSQLDYALRGWARRHRTDPAPRPEVDVRSLLVRRHAVVQVLRSRGLTFEESLAERHTLGGPGAAQE